MVFTEYLLLPYSRRPSKTVTDMTEVSECLCNVTTSMCLKHRVTLQHTEITSDVYTYLIQKVCMYLTLLSLLTAGMTTDRSKDCSRLVYYLDLRRAYKDNVL